MQPVDNASTRLSANDEAADRDRLTRIDSFVDTRQTSGPQYSSLASSAEGWHLEGMFETTENSDAHRDPVVHYDRTLELGADHPYAQMTDIPPPSYHSALKFPTPLQPDPVLPPPYCTSS